MQNTPITIKNNSTTTWYILYWDDRYTNTDIMFAGLGDFIGSCQIQETPSNEKVTYWVLPLNSGTSGQITAMESSYFYLSTSKNGLDGNFFTVNISLNSIPNSPLLFSFPVGTPSDLAHSYANMLGSNCCLSNSGSETSITISECSIGEGITQCTC